MPLLALALALPCPALADDAPASSPPVRVVIGDNLRKPLVDFEQPCNSLGDMPMAFSWKDRAYTLRLECAEDGLTSIELLSFDYTTAGPIIGILGIEATAGSALLRVDDWPVGFGDSPLGITVAAVER